MQFSAFSLLCHASPSRLYSAQFLRDSSPCSSVALHHIAVPPHTGAIPSRSTVSPRLALPFRFNSHPRSSFASHFRSYHCLCSSSRLIAVSFPDYSLPMLHHAVPCHSYAIRHSANPLTFCAILCLSNSAHFHGVSILCCSGASQCFADATPRYSVTFRR